METNPFGGELPVIKFAAKVKAFPEKLLPPRFTVEMTSPRKSPPLLVLVTATHGAESLPRVSAESTTEYPEDNDGAKLALSVHDDDETGPYMYPAAEPFTIE
jgi:hypothetical protein